MTSTKVIPSLFHWLARCKLSATLIVGRRVCVCLSVCLTATLMLNISETKRYMDSCHYRDPIAKRLYDASIGDVIYEVI